MSGDTDPEGDGGSPQTRRRATLATLGFALVVCVLAAAVSAVPAAAVQDSTTVVEDAMPAVEDAAITAQDNDTQAPAFGNATKGNLTTIELTITDDTDVDEATITAGDFALSTGDVADVAVNETGTDARVRISLSEIVSEDNVTVSIAEGQAISDAAGNQLREASVTVSGMDGYRPQLQAFEIERLDGNRVRVRVVASEQLSELFVGVGGPGTDTLTMANFTKEFDPARYEVPYAANVTLPQEGEYDVVVGTLVDSNGVQSRYSIEKTVLVDHTPPTAAIDAPARTTAETPVTFSAAPSTDEYGIATYNWSVDGNHTASGESFEHAFRTPGYHGVTLTVTDRRNNSASRTFSILVDSEATARDVTIDAANATAASVAVGPNRSVGRVRISNASALVSTATLRLDSLTVDVPVDTSATLDVSARANVTGWITDAAGGFDENTTTVGGFRVVHDRDLATATFRFSVNRSRLQAAGIDPADVTLYRETDGWRSVYTTRIESSDGWITYEATAAGLSRFVVADAGDGTASTGSAGGVGTGEPTIGGGPGASAGSARILVENSTLLTESVEPGDRAVVRAVARNRGNATGNYVVGLSINNSVVATTTVTVPPGENRTVTFAEPVDAGGSVVVNATLAGTLTVGDGASASTAGGGIPIPNPLALWPNGLLGRALGAVFWFVVVLYGVLKGLAIYLGY